MVKEEKEKEEGKMSKVCGASRSTTPFAGLLTTAQQTAVGLKPDPGVQKD